MLLLMLMPTMVTMALAMVDMEGMVDGEDMVDTPDMVLAMVDMVGTGEERRGMPMPYQLLMLNPMLTLMLMPTMVTMVLAMVDMEVMLDMEDMADMVLGMVDMEDMVSGVEKRGMPMPNQLLLLTLMLLLMLMPTMVTMALAMVDMEVMVDMEDMVDMVLGMVDIEDMVDMVSGVEKRGTLMLSQLLMQVLMLMPMLTTDTTDMAVDGEAMEDGEDMVSFTDLMAMDTGERNKRYSPQKW